MYTWFGQEWIDIKRKVYGIVNMEPNIFEVEITNVIDTVEEESSYLLTSAHIHMLSYYVFTRLFRPFSDVR